MCVQTLVPNENFGYSTVKEKVENVATITYQ